MSPLILVLVGGLAGGLMAMAITLVGAVGEPRPKYAPANRSDAIDQARRLRNARNRRLGAVLLALGVLVWPAGLVIKAALQSVGAFIEITPFLLASSAGLLTRGHQMRARDAIWVLEHDPRPPIVYLRPFAVDRAGPGLMSGDAFGTKTVERRMALTLRHVAPFVALGDPTELLPGLGADRLYADDAEWQREVEHLTGLGGTVILHAGDSPGLEWEVPHLISHVRPTRLVVWRGEVGDYDAFCRRFHDVLPAGLPGAPGPGDQLLSFDARWTPHWYGRGTAVGGTPFPGGADDQRSQVLAQLAAEFSWVPFRRTRRAVRRWRAMDADRRPSEAARWFTLPIALLLVAATSAAVLKAPPGVPDGLTRYTDPANRFSLTIPDWWEQAPASDAGLAGPRETTQEASPRLGRDEVEFVAFDPSDTTNQVHVAVEPAPATGLPTVDELDEMLSAAESPTEGPLVVVSHRVVALGNRRALRMVADGSYVVEGVPFVRRTTTYIVVTGGAAHQLTVSGDSPEAEAVAATYRVT